ncbi:hypothetical protein G7Y89_g10305 [Cudoniella acicularis]|uniref:Uncharacterized protein n=1 Tax=Cudoniella acicularis TaxID=354080 RepID=A0A8H4RFS8_9HELO|nr:hypothetical protein G7Y89_g10305 [Cudoniella acicularis]
MDPRLKRTLTHDETATIAAYLNDPTTSLYTKSLSWIEIAEDAGIDFRTNCQKTVQRACKIDEGIITAIPEVEKELTQKQAKARLDFIDQMIVSGDSESDLCSSSDNNPDVVPKSELPPEQNSDESRRSKLQKQVEKANTKLAMERTEGIIRWSPNPLRDEFMILNLNHKTLQVYEAKGRAQPGTFDFDKISAHGEIPPLNTYDWSPETRGLVAVGTSHGEVHLLRVDDNSNASLTLPLKLQRSCQSIAFNTTGLLAVGLDRIRNDSCLQIWDVKQRLADWDITKPGWSLPSMTPEPKKKLEGSVSITSVRFFEDQPQTLVVGVKNQSVRIHDLRDPNSAVVTFQTRCCNNLTIDFSDPNYFASSSLDQPGLLVWDRRASGRSTASPMYLESVDQDEIPWGAALKLNHAIDGHKNLYIKQLRYSREHRGTLGVLSSTGQLQIYRTNREFVEPDSVDDVRGSPELLEVKKSYDLEYPYSDPDHKRKFEDRIISFDWLNLGTTDLEPRVVGLRSNGTFEILQMPSATASHLSQVIPWQPPHRLGNNYMTLMNFADPIERETMLGPLYATAAKANVPVFGPNKYSLNETQEALVAKIKEAIYSNEDPVVNILALQHSDKSKDSTKALEKDISNLNLNSKKLKEPAESSASAEKLSKFFSSREMHEKYLYSALGGDPLDNIMLRRASEKYLFNCIMNKKVVSDDPWLVDVWTWIGCLEMAANEDGMVTSPIDLSYLGVYPIWMNILGEKSESRLIDSTVIPDSSQWERLIANINKKAEHPEFQGVATDKPHHRQLCLAICGLVKTPEQIEDELTALVNDQEHTNAAVWALFEGQPELAVEILKDAGTDLLFVAMALDMKLQSNTTLTPDGGKWSKALDTDSRLAEDPYLRALYGYITTGDWAAIVDEASLPLRDRVGVALRYFDDTKLTDWLSKQMEEVIKTGDIEGIVLAGITDDMVDILAKYIEKFMDYQTAILIMSFCYPRYLSDIRCDAWRKNYQDFLQRHKAFILRVHFEQQSAKKSRARDGKPVIKPPPRQVTIRCLKCDASLINDQSNTGSASAAPGPSQATADNRNPLVAAGINAGLSCPKCGSHLPRCAICLEYVGVPRSDRPELSNDPSVRRMANFPTFCMKCKHVTHMDHAVAWFKRHVECPVPECHCQCNNSGTHSSQLG